MEKSPKTVEKSPEKSILDYLDFEFPTLEQQKALLGMADFVSNSNTDDFFILSGAAGTGKTSITTALIQYLISRDIHYKIAAPTGRAARILGRKSKAISTTIHSLIYNTTSDPNSGEVFFKIKPNLVKDFTVFIFDEASMISSIVARDEGNLFISANSLLNDLVLFVKDGNYNNKIILLGDKNQLPPIQEDFSKALSKQFLEKKYNLKGSAYQLTEVKRQQKDSYILSNAMIIREAIDNKLPPEKLKDIEIQSINSAAMNLAKEYRQFGFDGSISIGASHKMNKLFNDKVRKILFESTPLLIVPDDLLIITSTWKRKGTDLYSGDHVIIQEIKLEETEFVAGLQFAPIKLRFKNLQDQEQLVEDFILLESITHPKGLKAEQERRLRFDRFRANEIYRKTGSPSDDKYVGAIRATYGYSITCHKAQGGEWTKVYVNTFYIPGLRYQYTAITRAREELIFY